MVYHCKMYCSVLVLFRLPCICRSWLTPLSKNVPNSLIPKDNIKTKKMELWRMKSKQSTLQQCYALLSIRFKSTFVYFVQCTYYYRWVTDDLTIEISFQIDVCVDYYVVQLVHSKIIIINYINKLYFKSFPIAFPTLKLHKRFGR